MKLLQKSTHIYIEIYPRNHLFQQAFSGPTTCSHIAFCVIPWQHVPAPSLPHPFSVGILSNLQVSKAK